ncbi:hypothetical protein [Gottfriedia solisilvae]|uniref:Uncharacterized protein n=1 Tax=Gottfriedia solisilvae TaxID=1516104 RepID=A0A8J3ALK1_9BACI|nr:hypothetical protein [Gottfriedia solisilvae]GGI12573.1 hypothetical protein GCM10007380_13590 [Gottfriedia solisilvae]
MAEKMYRKHVESILLDAKKDRTLDVFFALVEMANQFNLPKANPHAPQEYLFTVESEVQSLYSLCQAICNQVDHFDFDNNRSTIHYALKDLEDLGILACHEEHGYYMKDMEEMVKTGSKGYVYLRPVFFTEHFFKMKVTHRRLFTYMCYVLDTGDANAKFFKEYGVDIIINLAKQDKSKKLNWLSVLHTENVYYARAVIAELIDTYKHTFVLDESNARRADKFTHRKSRHIKSYFAFLVYPILKKERVTAEQKMKDLKERHMTLANMIEVYEKDYKLKMPTGVFNILVSKLAKYSRAVHERVIHTMFNKLHSEDIKPYLNVAGLEWALPNWAPFITSIIRTKVAEM